MATTWQTAKDLRARGVYECTLCGGSSAADADDVEWFGSDLGNVIMGHGECDRIEAALREPRATAALADFFASLNVDATSPRARTILVALLKNNSLGVALAPGMRPTR